MMNEIKEQLESEIASELEVISKLEPGGEQHTKAAETLDKLYKLSLQHEKTEAEDCEKLLRREQDREIEEKKIEIEQKKLELEEKKQKSEKRGKYVDWALKGAAIVLPLAFYGHYLGVGMKFEETGTFTSQTFRGFRNTFKPTKL